MDKKPSTGCLFCRLQKERGKRADAKNLVIWRGRLCFVVMNRFPYNSGHVLIVPYRHTSRFTNLSAEELAEVMQATGRCIEALEHVSKPQGFNFGANLGKTAGAGIDKHVHFHIVPRWNGDTNFMPVLSEVKLVSERLAVLQEKLSRRMNGKK